VKITDIEATTVTVPLEAPIRHSHGAHWGRFVRTIVQIHTDEGITGLGEMGGGGESAEAVIRGLKRYLVGHNPFHVEALRWKICDPTASLYNNRTQVHAALEFACLDIMGQKLGISVSDLLGGRLRDSVPFATYLFYRYPNEKTGVGGEETPEQMVAHAKDLKKKCGFRTHKLKGGHFTPDHDIDVFLALAESFPGDRFRLDPNGVWSVEESIRVADAIKHVRNDYLEDPCYGFDAMRRLRQRINIPTATNEVVVSFPQLAQCIKTDAIDVILLDTTFWGGLRQAHKAAGVCETFGWGISVHSSGELGIQLATMLHLGATIPNLQFAADAHYHHVVDDIIVGGKMQYMDGHIKVPTTPGLGVKLDKDKLKKYSELFKELGGYPYDRDPKRPDWYALWPGEKYAVPGRPGESVEYLG
jgi:glucarate dehydratase